VRGVVHVAAALALTALAFAFGRWLRDPSQGGPLLILIGAAILLAVAMGRLYRPGGPGRAAVAPEPEPVVAAPPDARIDLNAADATDLQRLPGIGPVGARRIVEEREAGGPYRTVGDLARVAGFGPSRVRGLTPRVRV
jgi:competence ComEA-like helix-hairpin-helix protein